MKWARLQLYFLDEKLVISKTAKFKEKGKAFVFVEKSVLSKLPYFAKKESCSLTFW